MKISFEWLKEFVDFDLTPEELADKLVNCGFEVEDIAYEKNTIKNVVAGRITSIEKHPNADKLSVCGVDIGGRTVQIVTAATNVFEGAVVPVALDDSLLPSGLKIFKSELRGVPSHGMFVSGEELKLAEEDFTGAGVNGILILRGVVPGADIGEVIGLTDAVLDISVTANRPDCNSVIGIAREVAAITKSQFKPHKFDYPTAGKSSDYVSVEVKNAELCPRYMAQAVKNAVIKPAPAYMRKRLKAVGIRPINNIVDITNYVLIEIGQPMHAFDRDNLVGAKIVVRTAEDGESIISLDGKNNVLKPSMLVIADESKPVAVAGIMGGEYSGITEATKEIIFESAKFARDSVRRTSRALNLKSDSSARFEKGIDFMSQKLALDRAMQLIYETGSGEIIAEPIDVKVNYQASRTVSYSLDAVNRILGITVPAKKILEILNGLGIKTAIKGGCFVSEIPEYREDIENANDIAEEVIRVYGYGNLKSTLLSDAHQTTGGKSAEYALVDRVRTALVGAGAAEIITYSFISPKAFELLRLPEGHAFRNALKIRNPLGEDVSVMRTTLLPSMLNIVALNLAKFNRSGLFFEIARCYIPNGEGELPEEEETLILAGYGEDFDFYSLKGIAERAAGTVALEMKRKEYPYLHGGRSAEIFASGVSVGYIGEIHPDILESLDVGARIYVAEIKLLKLLKYEQPKKFKPFSNFPPVSRDLAVIVKDGVQAGDMLAAIRSAATLLESVEVFDVYTGTGIKKGFKSVAFSLLFRHTSRTLKDEEVAAEMENILAALEKKYQAKLR